MTRTSFTVAVCDDDALARTELLRLLSKALLPQGYRISVTEASSGDELLLRHRDGERFDIIFLDMMMPGANGIETATALRAAGDKAIIVCLTSSPDFAVESYRIDAFDYLMKTKGMAQLEDTLGKAIMALASKEPPRLHIKSGTTTCAVLCSNIEFIEVFSKKLSYHLVSGEVIESYKPLRELEAELSGLAEFFRIHRSLIVNLACVTQIDPRFVRTLSSEKLPVARGKYEDLEKAFLRCSAKG